MFSLSFEEAKQCSFIFIILWKSVHVPSISLTEVYTLSHKPLKVTVFSHLKDSMIQYCPKREK